jgi:putative hydrolase of the HAD superfamily
LRSDSTAAVLFDLGGVLVHLDYAAIAAEAAALGFPLDAAALPRAEGFARRAIDARASAAGTARGTDAARVPDYFDDVLAGAGLAAPARAELVPRLRAHHRERNLWRVPFSCARATLERLNAAGLRLGVVSNADGRAAAILAATGLAPSLDVIVDSHFEGVEKPDPEIFRRALARLGAAANETLFVGDIPSIDVVGARNAGLRPVLLDAAGVYSDADCDRIARPGELLGLLGLGAAGGIA